MRRRELKMHTYVCVLVTVMILGGYAHTQACYPLPVGAVGWWQGNGDPTDVLTGFSGMLKTFSLYETPFLPAIVGDGFAFDGIDDYVEINNRDTLNPSTGLTVMAWYYTQSFAGNGNNAIVQKPYYINSSPFYQYHLGIIGDQYTPQCCPRGAGFQFWVAAGGAPAIVSTPRDGTNFWVPGQWYHVAGTYDGAAIKLYVNGALIDTKPASGVLSNFATPVLLGGFYYLNRGGIDYTPGKIDEAAIFGRALSASEVQAIYNAGSAGMCKRPIDLLNTLTWTVQTFNLQQGIANSLDAKLQRAKDALSAAKAGDVSSACSLLTATVGETETQEGAKITTAQADQIEAQIRQIQLGLGCS